MDNLKDVAEKKMYEMADAQEEYEKVKYQRGKQ